jgi:hypothetical protein
MIEHNLFYYPYASFTNTQLPLLKVAALYFDKLYILDPEKATGGSVGSGDVAADVALLEREHILTRVSPEEVLKKYEDEIAAAIRADLDDSEFLRLCEQSGRAQLWTLALAKVPKEIREHEEHREYAKLKPQDEAMQHLMGDLPRSLAGSAMRYTEGYAEVTQRLSGQEFVYDEERQSGSRQIEYRYADYPLPLGEAIMMNHALFAGLLYAEATPVTDDRFHNEALSLKLRRAARDPAVQDSQAKRAEQSRIDLLAHGTLTDSRLSLPVLDPKLSLEEVLAYRAANDAALRQTRDKLGRMAGRIKAEPWSEAFATELKRETIPKVLDELDEARKARDAWLQSNKGRLALSGTSILLGAAAVGLAVFAAPVTPIALAIAGVSLGSSAAIPGVQWARDWRDGKKSGHANGLHYLLSEPVAET